MLTDEDLHAMKRKEYRSLFWGVVYGLFMLFMFHLQGWFYDCLVLVACVYCGCCTAVLCDIRVVERSRAREAK